MGISIGLAIRNIRKDPEWLVKTGILSMCFIISALGQFMFDNIKKNPNFLKDEIFIAAIILVIASIITTCLCSGYMFQYLHNIRKDVNANLPDWENLGNLLKIGFWGTFMPALVGFLIAVVSIPLITMIVTIPFAIYYAYCSSALMLAYAEDFDGRVFFHIGEAKQFLGWNYFFCLIVSVFICILVLIPIMIFSYFSPLYAVLLFPLYGFATLMFYALLGQVFHLESEPDSDHVGY